MTVDLSHGFANIPRALLLDEEVLNHPLLLKLLCYFYGRAQWKERIVHNGRGMPMALKPGQLYVPHRQMAEELKTPVGTLNRAIMEHWRNTYWNIHNSRKGRIIELIYWVSGTPNGTLNPEKMSTRSNMVLPSEVSNISEGDSSIVPELNVPTAQQVTAKWLEGRALSAGVQHDDLDFYEEIEKQRIQAEEEGKRFDRAYMWRRWCWAVENARRFQKQKKSAAGDNGSGVILYFEDGEFRAV